MTEGSADEADKKKVLDRKVNSRSTSESNRETEEISTRCVCVCVRSKTFSLLRHVVCKKENSLKIEFADKGIKTFRTDDIWTSGWV